MSKIWRSVVQSVTEDQNLHQAKAYFDKGVRAAPSATSQYLLEKISLSGVSESIPEGTQIFKLQESLLFANANRVKKSILDTVYTYTSGVRTAPKLEKDRLWNESGEKYMRALRAKAGVDATPAFLRVAILDFSNVKRIDLTGIQVIVDLKADVKRYGGEHLELRFVAMNERVRKTFERDQWDLSNAEDENVRDGGDMVFDVIQHALGTREKPVSNSSTTSDIEALEIRE